MNGRDAGWRVCDASARKRALSANARSAADRVTPPHGLRGAIAGLREFRLAGTQFNGQRADGAQLSRRASGQEPV
jgi:hypothetical protein